MVLRCRHSAPLLVLAFTAAACGRDPIAADGDTGTSTASEDPSCIPGEADCECNGGLCLAGLECIDNICGSPECIPGDLGCECNDGLCLMGLECVAGLCTEPGGDGDGDTTNGTSDTTNGTTDTTDTTTDTTDATTDTTDATTDGDPCGNGSIDLGEDCDDGNNDNGDGCNNDCTDSGSLLWEEVFTVFNNDDYGNGVAVDSSDQIFVSGSARVVNNDIDAWYRKYSSNGQLVWEETYDGPAGPNYSPDGCYRIAADPDDDILVACWSHDGFSSDAMLRKFDQNGTEIWTRTFNVLGDDNLYGVAAAADGTMVVSGQSNGYNAFLRRYDALGTEIWTRTFTMAQRGRDVGYTANGDIAVVFDPGRYTRLYTTGGTLVWTYPQNIGNAFGLAIDGNDVLLAGDEMMNPSIGWFGRLDPNGGLAWEETWVGNGNMYAYSQDIAVDSAGRILVVGARIVLDAGALATTRKYSPDGQTLIWERTLQGAKAYGSNGATSVAIDSQDNVIVVGCVDGDVDWDAFVVKYGP